jgi:metallo-beta-lactamase class B
MSVKPALTLAALLTLGACAPQPLHMSTVRLAISTPDARTMGAQLETACEGRDGWADAAPPARIHGNTYYVGTCGIAVLLVTSTQGHVLIDGATEEAVPSILANIRSLGFDPRDIRFIIGSHEHLDHMGGFAALKAATGAQVWASEAARPSLENGTVDADDPQHGIITGMRPVPVHGIVSDGTVISTDNDSVRLTAMRTPGHTSGGTSWTWRSCEAEACVTFAYVDSMTAVSADSYRFTDHPERVAPYRTTFDRVAAMPCDVLITPHPSFSNLFPRLSGTAPLVDSTACRRLSETMRGRLDARLAQEASGG